MMLQVLVYDSCDKMNKFGKNTVYSIAEGDEEHDDIGLKRFTSTGVGCHFVKT